MNIFVRNISDKTLSLIVDPKAEITTIKCQINAKENITPQDLSLIYDGKELIDTKTLSDYSVTPYSTLLYVPRLKGGGYELFVKTLSGKTIKLDVEDNERVENVTAKLEATEGIPAESKYLSLLVKGLKMVER